MTPRTNFQFGLLFLLVFAGCTVTKDEPQIVPAIPPILSFDDCVAAGNPVMESYPRQCTVNGQIFREEITEPVVEPEEEETLLPTVETAADPVVSEELPPDVTAPVTNIVWPEVENGVQLLRMRVTEHGYEPSTLVAKSGIPIVWVVEGTNYMSCADYLFSRDLDVGERVKYGENRIELGTLKPGIYQFSCGMNMFRGSINVT